MTNRPWKCIYFYIWEYTKILIVESSELIYLVLQRFGWLFWLKEILNSQWKARRTKRLPLSKRWWNESILILKTLNKIKLIELNETSVHEIMMTILQACN
jgi:hypothetical protein